MTDERKYDQLDYADVTSFGQREHVEAFARAAVEHFAERPDHWTFTDAKIDGELLAIRWGSAGQAVLVCRLDEGFRATIFGDCLPNLEKTWGGDGGGWMFYAHRTRSWLEGMDESPAVLSQRLADVLSEVARNYLRAHGAPDGPVSSLARRLSEDVVPSVFRRVFGRPKGELPPPRRLRLRVQVESDDSAPSLVVDYPGGPADHDGRRLSLEEAEAVAEVWNRRLQPASSALRVFRRASGGALVCDLPIPGITSPLSGETASDYGAPFFVAESMGLETARALAHALGGVLEEDLAPFRRAPTFRAWDLSPSKDFSVTAVLSRVADRPMVQGWAPDPDCGSCHGLGCLNCQEAATARGEVPS